MQLLTTKNLEGEQIVCKTQILKIKNQFSRFLIRQYSSDSLILHFWFHNWNNIETKFRSDSNIKKNIEIT